MNLTQNLNESQVNEDIVY